MDARLECHVLAGGCNVYRGGVRCIILSESMCDATQTTWQAEFKMCWK